MIFFINFLRALAAVLITNAHYTGIYPTDLIANGGLLGDILFFCVSGYCLSNIKMSFPRWYGKRILRCYIPTVIITLVYMFFGFYKVVYHSWFWWLVYPTYYHFVASIIVIYIPYYIILRIEQLKNNLPLVMIITCILYFFVYMFFYDKTYYHIDSVHEPMIRFLFMESMLLGAYFRIKDENFRNKFSWRYPILSVLVFILYFASKVLFSKNLIPVQIQIVNQFIIFALLFFIFRTFSSIDSKLEKLPVSIKKIIEYIAKITLEIYVVQYVLIDKLRNLFDFPFNWLLITFSILVSASLLHVISDFLIKKTDRFFVVKK